MQAYLYLPHAPRSSVHVGKTFIRSAEHGRHVWKNRIFNLADERERAEFNALVASLCIKDTIYGQTPVPFILPPAAAQPEPEAPPPTPAEDAVAGPEAQPEPPADAVTEPAPPAAKKTAKKAAKPKP